MKALGETSSTVTNERHCQSKLTYGVLLQLDTGKKRGLSCAFGRNIRD